MNAERIPDFVIAGAAKAGTTSLHWMLSQHPEIFMSSVKETNYFADMPRVMHGPGDQQHTADRVVRTEAEYRSLFAGRTPGQRTGESSPSYLYYHDTAAAGIREANPRARVIVLLRDPVERTFSHYLNMVRDLREPLGFDEALEAEDRRARDGWEWTWQYRGAGLYADAVASYFDTFGRDAVFVTDFDRFRSDPERVTAEVLRFLELQPAGSSKPVHANPSGVPKNRRLQRFLAEDNLLKSALKAVIPRRWGSRAKNWVITRNIDRPEMTPEQRARLRRYFEEDVTRLAGLLEDPTLLRWVRE